MSVLNSASQPERSSHADPHPREPSVNSSYRIVILGGGEAGLAVLKSLQDSPLASEIALIEPSSYHYDQPSWMHVGTEGKKKEETRSEEVSRIPSEVTWIQERARSIEPEETRVTLESGKSIDYEYLVVALGTQTHWDRIRGLKQNIGSHGICSVYGYEQSERTWEMIRDFEGGRALFTAPSTPYKGGGAPISILQRAEAIWEETGVRPHTEIFFTTAAPPESAGTDYAEMIDRADREDSIHIYMGYDLIEVRPESREALFRVAKGQSQSQDVLPYDLIHVVPPMRPPALLEQSALAYQDGPLRGHLEVAPRSLRHKRFKTVFGVGDVVGDESVKTGEKAREQAAEVAKILERVAC